jgi:hypothetical protein
MSPNAQMRHALPLAVTAVMFLATVLALAGCSDDDLMTVVEEEPLAPAPEAMAGDAPTTVNPTPEPGEAPAAAIPDTPPVLPEIIPEADPPVAVE